MEKSVISVIAPAAATLVATGGSLHDRTATVFVDQNFFRFLLEETRYKVSMAGQLKEIREDHLAGLSRDVVQHLKTLEDYRKTNDFLTFHADAPVVQESYELTRRSFEEQDAMNRQKLEEKLGGIAKKQFEAGLKRRGWREIERQHSLYRYRHIMTTAEMQDFVTRAQQKLWRGRPSEDEACTGESMPENHLQRT